MALSATYKTGTVTVAANGTIVTGAGTNWLAGGIRAGDVLAVRGLTVSIAAVTSATSITLATTWPGAALSNAEYEIRYTPDASRVLASSREAIAAMENIRGDVFVSANVYVSPAAGLAATSPGQQFQTISVNGQNVIRYRHDAGGVATEVARYPTAAGVTDAVSLAQTAVSQAEAVATTAADAIRAQVATDADRAEVAAATLTPIQSDLIYMKGKLVEHTASTAGQTADMSVVIPDASGGFRVGVLAEASQPAYADGGNVTRFKIRVMGACTVAASTWTKSGDAFTRHQIAYFTCPAAGYHEFPCSIAIPRNGLLGYGVPPNMLGAHSGLTVLRWFATGTDVAQFTDATSENSRGMVAFVVDAPTGIIVPDNGALAAAQQAQASIGMRTPDIDYMSENLIIRVNTPGGQTADMSALPPDTASGSRTMVVVSGANSRYANGGIVDRFEIYLSSAVRFSVSSWTENTPGSGTTFTPHQVKYFDGVAGWNVVDPQVTIPKGGLVGFGTSVAASTGVNQALAQIGVRATSTTENVQFTAASTVNVKLMAKYNVSAPAGLDLPEGGGSVIDRNLIDKRFTDATGWTLASGSIVSGVLSSGASTSWFNPNRPTGYPYSQLTKRTFSVFASVVAADQKWGISSIRQNNGYDLFTTAAIVDGTDGRLKIYRYDSVSGVAPTTAVAEVAIPWTLAGSSARLDLVRNRFALTATLTNLASGVSVSINLNYATGEASNEITGRPWGIPCILFPSTTAGGVTVSRARMVADMPYPAGSAAAVICLGDSITEGSSMMPDFDKCWSYLLEDERAAKGARDTVVSARGGQESAGLLGAVPEVVRLCDSNTVVVIMIGTNDAERGAATHAGWRTNLTAILAQLRAKTERIALCCLPPGNAGGNAKRALMNADILAGYFGPLLPPVRFDLALTTNNDGVTTNPAYRLDSVHPNVAGNAAMLARLRLDCPEAFE